MTDGLAAASLPGSDSTAGVDTRAHAAGGIVLLMRAGSFRPLLPVTTLHRRVKGNPASAPGRGGITRNGLGLGLRPVFGSEVGGFGHRVTGCIHVETFECEFVCNTNEAMRFGVTSTHNLLRVSSKNKFAIIY